MSQMNAQTAKYEGHLYAKLIKANGKVIDYGELKAPWYHRLFSHWKTILGFSAAGLLAYFHPVAGLPLFGLVTDTGIFQMAKTFLTSGPYNMSTMTYHDSGTGTTAEAATQTALVTPAGPSTRATGAQTAPTGGASSATSTMQSVGTIAYAGPLAITEWGLFDASTQGAGGNMWDRRVFSAINVVSGDSIQFTYTVTFTTTGGT